MVMTDPIADMLTRMRNALQAKHKSVSVPASKTKLAISWKAYQVFLTMP